MNSTNSTLPPMLDFLRDYMPPSHITLVGAGNGKSTWAQWFGAQATPATLVEADTHQFSALQRLQAAGNFANASLLHTVVAAEAGEVAFYTCSLAAESGLVPAEAVQQLWPNVHQLQASQRQATGLAEVLPPQLPNQWLVLDCLPAAALVKHAASVLAQVDVVVARVLLTANQAHLIPGTGLAELAGLFPDFVQLALQPTRHPAIAYALLVRDYRSATVRALEAHAAEGQAKQAAIQAQQTLQAQLQQATQQNADLLKKQERQAQAQQALEANLVQITQAHEAEGQAKQVAIQAQQALQAQLLQAQQKNADLLQKQELQVQAHQALKADLERAIQVQEQLQTLIAHKADWQALFKSQADELMRVRKFLDASLKKEITNATRQIQAFTGLENYWRTGELPTANTESHSWPVSPDFSLYVVSLVEQNNYDLVIEFGSGISTVVIAKALSKMASRQKTGKPPVGFASFDHLPQYYQQTLDMLQQAHLAQRVQLHHTPLQEWQAQNGNTYPYYACQAALAALAQQYSPMGLRVLVIVDGPPAATGPHARYPACPLVLQHFAGAHIDFLMDDYIRADEKEIVQLWQAEMTAAQIPHTSTQRKLEKDACLVQALPRA